MLVPLFARTHAKRSRLRACATPIALLAALAVVGPTTVRGQDQIQEFEAPAHIAYVDGDATLDRDGQSQAATGGMPLVEGDRVATTAGRVEVLFPDGTALDVDEFSSFELLSPTLLRLTSGRVLLLVTGSRDPASATRYQIDTAIASAFTDGPGEYRLSLVSGVSGQEAELAVVRGYGSLSTEFGSTEIRAGERTLARNGTAPSSPYRFNAARYDAFDQWAQARRDDRTASVSNDYLPPDLRMYSSTLDRHGSWSYEASYGYVWYPTVAATWRPYYHGYWSPIRRYGWTWIGYDVWGWPTHHYGRWGYARSRWFWIPQRHWAPAWVSWGAAPGYVSWCPLGFNNRPVFALSINVGHTWSAWTVLPRDRFGYYDVRRYAVPGHRIAQNTGFVVQNTAPIPPPRAIPRRAAQGGVDGGGVAVGRAIPRGATSRAGNGVIAAPRDGTGSAASARTGLPARSAPRSIESGRSAAGGRAAIPRAAAPAGSLPSGGTGNSRSTAPRASAPGRTLPLRGTARSAGPSRQEQAQPSAIQPGEQAPRGRQTPRTAQPRNAAPSAPVMQSAPTGPTEQPRSGRSSPRAAPRPSAPARDQAGQPGGAFVRPPTGGVRVAPSRPPRAADNPSRPADNMSTRPPDSSGPRSSAPRVAPRRGDRPSGGGGAAIAGPRTGGAASTAPRSGGAAARAPRSSGGGGSQGAARPAPPSGGGDRSGGGGGRSAPRARPR